MRCRTLATSASLALVLLLSSSMARADDRAPRHKPEAPELPAPTHVTVDVGSFKLGQAAEHAQLGKLWTHVVEAAVGALKSLATLQQVAAAREAIRPARAAPARLSFQRDVGATLHKERPRPPRVRPTPVAADTAIVAEAREQHAILLGAEMSLPWQAP